MANGVSNALNSVAAGFGNQYAQQNIALQQIGQALQDPNANPQQLMSVLASIPGGQDYAKQLFGYQYNPIQQLIRQSLNNDGGSGGASNAEVSPSNVGGITNPAAVDNTPPPVTDNQNMSPIPQGMPGTQSALSQIPTPQAAPGMTPALTALSQQQGRAQLLKGLTGGTYDITGNYTVPIEQAREAESRTYKESQDKPTDSQTQAATFAKRMVSSGNVIDDLTSKGFDPASTTQKAASEVPGIGNFLITREYQQNKQAQKDWILAMLRKESGAAIGVNELASYEKIFFPQPGDAPETVQQKRDQRANITTAMQEGAGKFYKAPVASKQSTNPASQFKEGQTATNPKTGQKITFINGTWQ